MLFYHYTFGRHLASVRLNGLRPGPIEIHPVKLLEQGVWLLDAEGPHCDLPYFGCFRDVRITVEIADDDEQLWNWSDLVKRIAGQRTVRTIRKILRKMELEYDLSPGCMVAQFVHKYVYLAPIPPHAIRAIEPGREPDADETVPNVPVPNPPGDDNDNRRFITSAPFVWRARPELIAGRNVGQLSTQLEAPET
jgi:hypothetical protein